MERQPRARQRAQPSMEAPAAANRTGWMPSTVLAGAGVVGVVGAAGYLAYRMFVAPASSKKLRSKHGKKNKKKTSTQEPIKAPVATKSGTSTPRTPPRSESPTASAKIVPDSSRLDQLAWWVEIAKDQFSVHAHRHAKYYADKALAIGESVPDFKSTLAYCHVLFISIYVSPNRDAMLPEAKSGILSTLAKMEDKEGNKREFMEFKAKFYSSLSDLATRQKNWEDTERYGSEAMAMHEKLLADQGETKFDELAIANYQMISAKRNLKKMEEALQCAVKAYEYFVKSKLKPEFSSAAARQRADLLDILGRYEEAVVVIRDHLERMEALRAASLEASASKKDKTVDNDSDDDEAYEASSATPMVSPNIIADNLLYLARLMFQHADYEEAIASCHKAIALVPSVYYYSMLASIQFEAGKMEDALETQTQLKKITPKGDLPISTSRNLLTKLAYIRQPKLDGPWTVQIHLANQPIKSGSEELSLKAGALIELYVRRHIDAHEPVTGDVTPMGPFVYIVKGDEADGAITLKGLLPKPLESNAVYELVIYQYPSQDQRSAEQRIGTHRQMSRAFAYSSISLANATGMAAPGSFDDLADDLDDFALPEPREEEDVQSEAILAHAPSPIVDDVDEEDIDADEHPIVSAIPETRQEAAEHGHVYHSAAEASEDAPAQQNEEVEQNEEVVQNKQGEEAEQNESAAEVESSSEDKPAEVAEASPAAHASPEQDTEEPAQEVAVEESEESEETEEAAQQADEPEPEIKAADEQAVVQDAE